MAYAYTPGLKVKSSTVIRKTRRLPIQGEVLVNKGDSVEHNTVVARTRVPGEAFVVKAAHALGIEREEIKQFMIKNIGDVVQKGESIALKTALFGLLKSACPSPTAGTVELISELTGQVTIREPPVPVDISAYIRGRVHEILPKEGVVIETIGAFIQGIFGIGGETHGQIVSIVDSPNQIISEDMMKVGHSGRIVVGGSLITGEALKKAMEHQVRGIIVGGIEDKDLIDFLGYEVGVAVTGGEDVGTSLMITEGFGNMAMSQRTFSILRSYDGQEASMNGATQIRAGVIRPEIVIPKAGNMTTLLGEAKESQDGFTKGMEIGMKVRVIREPHFGAIGTVSALPVALQQVQTKSEVRVMEIQLENAQRVLVPRANVEIIEE